MKEDIIAQKIRRELNNLPIDTEPRVMYLLVEIRKILEHEKNKGGVLGFYCDWVVHTKMDRFNAQELYEKINKDDSESSRIVSFDKLKNELKEFLEERDLSTNLIVSHWELFREKLIDILVDTPIEKKEKIVGSFFYRRTGTSGIEFCFKDEKGIKSLGKIVTQ